MTGIDMLRYYVRDILCALSLLLVPYFYKKDVFSKRNIFKLLLFYLFLTGINAPLRSFISLINGEDRLITWNVVNFNISIIAGLILLDITQKVKAKILIVLAISSSLFGIIMAQTRSTWIALLVSFLIYILIRFKQKGKKYIIYTTMTSITIFIVIIFSFEIFFDLSIQGIIENRISSTKSENLFVPTSSIGYRIYESLMVWKERSLWGHGPGATIYLFFPWLGYDEFIHWWSIHSEYFETLHKYGFIGLFIYIIFLCSFILKSFRQIFYKDKVLSLFALFSFLSLINISLVSITSGYFMKGNMMMTIVFLIGLIEYNSYTQENKFKHNP